MKQKQVSEEALERMRQFDAAQTWTGSLKCCGKKLSGTPAQLKELAQQHKLEGCNGA